MRDRVIKTDDYILKEKTFLDCIGSGRLDLALREDYLNSLRMVQKDIGFKYVRAHGVFSKDMGIYRTYAENGVEKEYYNYNYLDKIFDDFLSMNIRPFLELGFMPNELASDENSVFWWEGKVSPPRKYNKWNELVQNVLRHLIERYGLDEVLTWPIEIWNEPNLTDFWKDADQKEYFKLFKESFYAIKSVNTNFKVGGPAICGGSDFWMKDFLEFCVHENIQIDFMSRHAYSSGPAIIKQFRTTQKILSKDSLLEDFKSCSKYLNKYYTKQIPVYITEFNTSYTPDNPVHDTAFNAAYLAPILSQGMDLVSSFSYWTFSDMFEEKGIPTSFLYGGFGLTTYNQIKKPTYYLYEFFSKLSEKEIYKDDNCHIGWGKNGELVIISWNPTENVFIKEIKLKLPINSQWYCERKTINEKFGNVNNAWEKMGMPRWPNAFEKEALKSASLPLTQNSTFKTTESNYDFSFEMDKNELTLFRISIRSNDYQTF